jgi:hypothetical protein
MSDPAAIVQKWMLALADKIADQADASADGYRDVAGDVALRSFAAAIRNTNAAHGFIPETLKH